MKKLLLITMLLSSGISLLQAQPTRTIFITGGDFSTTFIKYVIALTKKTNPKICFIPTASADNPGGIAAWYERCTDLPMKLYVLRTFINSSPEQQSFEEIIMSMDAIIVGGGNTLNMMAIWKAQGIDTVLRKAYDKGIILSGGSAGSLCWFQGGTTDSRPKDLSIVHGLGFIPTSHCPHYHSELLRKPLYFDNILKGKLSPGYAIDDKAGIVFENEKYVKSVALDDKNNTYYVSVVNGQVDEKLLPVTEILK